MMPRYRDRKKKVLTPAQRAALAAYEPHLSAATRQSLESPEMDIGSLDKEAREFVPDVGEYDTVISWDVSKDYSVFHTCQGCAWKGATVRRECSRTMYHFEGEPGSPEDPNRYLLLCRTCAKQHHEFWDDMWAEWNNSRG